MLKKTEVKIDNEDDNMEYINRELEFLGGERECVCMCGGEGDEGQRKRQRES